MGATFLLLTGVRQALSATRLSDEDALDASFALPEFASTFPGIKGSDIGKLGSIVFQGNEGDDLDEEEGRVLSQAENAPRSSGRTNSGSRSSASPARGTARNNATARTARSREVPNTVAVRRASVRERTRSRRAGQAARSVRGWPVAGRLTSRFGFRRHPITGRKRFHCGMDLAAPLGSPIHALREGVIAFSGRRGGYGWCVDIRHPDGVVSRYAHNSANLVKAGAKVRKGSVIAKVGSSGHSTGPHVHLEIIRHGTRINPQKYLARR
ncbi:MAG: M23 family metallopeptidase [Candidatus Hydrogenedentota bacterium]